MCKQGSLWTLESGESLDTLPGSRGTSTCKSRVGASLGRPWSSAEGIYGVQWLSPSHSWRSHGLGVQRGSRQEETGAVKTRPECVVIKWATEQWRPKSLVTPKRQVDKNAGSLSQESCLGLTLISPRQGQGSVHLSRPELLHVKEGGRSVCSFSMLFYFTPSHLARGGILCLPHLHPLSQHHPAPRARAPSTDQILLPIIVCNLENGWLYVFLWNHPEVDLMVILQKLSLGGHSWWYDSSTWPSLDSPTSIISPWSLAQGWERGQKAVLNHSSRSSPSLSSVIGHLSLSVQCKQTCMMSLVSQVMILELPGLCILWFLFPA